MNSKEFIPKWPNFAFNFEYVRSRSRKIFLKPLKIGSFVRGQMKVLTLRDAAEFLNCHPSTLYRLAKRGEIPAFRLGGTWRFAQLHLIEWMRDQTKALAKPSNDRARWRQRH
jgi:excisionase family DNA binding protein